jgi:hypothetical protein
MSTESLRKIARTALLTGAITLGCHDTRFDANGERRTEQ